MHFTTFSEYESKKVIVCVSSYYYVCPHTTVCVSSYCTMCVLILLYMCLHTPICALNLLHVSAYYYIYRQFEL